MVNGVKTILVILALIGLTSCGPRNAVGLANVGGISQTIGITEEDASLSNSRVTIRFDGDVVEQSLLDTWTEEAQKFNLYAVYKDIVVNGRTIRVRRKFSPGVASTTLTYQFFEKDSLIASVPIAF
jgi:hypothetical protein